MATILYSLSDPRTGEIRYIGKTLRQKAVKRLNEHVCHSRHNKTHAANWIRSLNGARPVMRVLVIVEDVSGAETEIALIALYRSKGHRLTNLTKGGEGNLGYKATAETRARLSAAHKGKPGRPLSDEAKAKISAANKGRKYGAVALANIRAAQFARRGFKLTPEQIEQRRVSMLGNTRGFKKGHQLSPEHRARLTELMKGNQWNKGRTHPAYNKGMRHTPEAREKIRQAGLQRWALQRAAAN